MGRIGMTVALALMTMAAWAGENHMELQPEWEYVADTVMGGVSTGQIDHEEVAGRTAVRLTGDVSLENKGGFIQMAFDLAQGEVMDASGWSGIEVDVIGAGEGYELRLRTDELARPWHSYRTTLEVSDGWRRLRLPWDAFEQRKTDVPFDPARLRRVGILAIGAQMQADIAVSGIRLYR